MSKLPSARVSYSLELASAICDQLADGDLLPKVCAAPGMPKVSTVFGWLKQHPEFAEMYSLAKEVQADNLAAQIIEISDTCRTGEKTEKKELGRFCSSCLAPLRWAGKWRHTFDGELGDEICTGATSEKITEDKVSTADMVERSRLQVDARKWLLSKIMPKRYGDRLELAGKIETEVTLSVAEVMRQRRQKMLNEKEKNDEA